MNTCSLCRHKPANHPESWEVRDCKGDLYFDDGSPYGRHYDKRRKIHATDAAPEMCFQTRLTPAEVLAKIEKDGRWIAGEETTLDGTLGNLDVLDALRESIGLPQLQPEDG